MPGCEERRHERTLSEVMTWWMPEGAVPDCGGSLSAQERPVAGPWWRAWHVRADGHGVRVCRLEWISPVSGQSPRERGSAGGGESAEQDDPRASAHRSRGCNGGVDEHHVGDLLSIF